jgi:co-chaperonin GroES (HSP10)
MHDRVALRRVDNESKTSGGVIIPDTAAEKPQQGEVAVGPGARGEDGKVVQLDLKKGDRSCSANGLEPSSRLITQSFYSRGKRRHGCDRPLAL